MKSTFTIGKAFYSDDFPDTIFIMNSKHLGGFNYKDNSNWLYKFADYKKAADPYSAECNS